MKKLLLIILCLPIIGFGQLTMIPDANFEQRLISFGYDNTLDGTVLTAAIDTVTSLYVGYYGISDLTGIEDFTALTILNCGANDLTSLDVSNNTALIELNCGLNQLTSLDLSNNINLENLHCPENIITTIDFSNSANIMDVNCENNQIYSLDISQNSLLAHLELKDNKLFYLNLKNGANTLLNHMRVTDNPNLTCISVDDSLWATNNWNVFQDIDPQQYFSNNCPPSAIQEHTTNKELVKVTDLLGRETKQTNQPLLYIYDDGTVEKRIVIE